jgi:hypothetical protein
MKPKPEELQFRSVCAEDERSDHAIPARGVIGPIEPILQAVVQVVARAVELVAAFEEAGRIQIS